MSPIGQNLSLILLTQGWYWTPFLKSLTMQKITLLGNVGSQDQIKIVKLRDRDVLSFTLAVTTRDKNTTWYTVLYNNVNFQQYLTKGKRLVVVGDLVVKVTQTNQEKTYVNLNVYANTVEFASSNTDGQQAQPQQQQPQPTQSLHNYQQNSTIITGNSELPF